MTGPAAPAEGRNGRWVKLGDVSVDGATMGISAAQCVLDNYQIGFNDTDGEPDERIAQIVVTLIDAEDLAYWNTQP